MMKKVKKIVLTIFLSCFIFSSYSFAQPRVEVTFSSCSLYLSAEDGTSSEVSYRKTGDKLWKKTFPLYYDSKLKEFRGSIVLLDEDTEYEVRSVLSKSAKVIDDTTITFRTWSSSPVIGKEVTLSSLIGNENNYVDIRNLQGNPDAWVRIIPDIPLQAGYESDFALRFTNCHYVILEGATISGGSLNAVEFPGNTSNVRLINCNISKWGRAGVSQNKQGNYLDKDGNRINYDSGIKIDRAKSIVIERCFIHSPNGTANPWSGVVEIGEYAGTKYKTSHPMGPNGIFIAQNGGNLVIRYNDIVGSQLHRYNDAIEGMKNGYVEGGFYNDADIYGNIMAFGQDDGIELDGGQCNVRLYGNRFEQTYSGISLAPNKKGPSYIFYNVVTNLGASNGVSSAAVKNGGGLMHTAGYQYLFNNTMIFSGNGMRGVGYGPSDAKSKREMFRAYTRNNIFLATKPSVGKGKDSKGYSISDIHECPENDFDFDLLGNVRNEGGSGKVQARKGAETNGVFASPKFTSLYRGVYTLLETDPAVGKGVAVPNFMENFKGDAPDIGAFQLGASNLYPIRPLDINSDYYHVRMDIGTKKVITLNIGNVEESEFSIQKAEDMDWLEVSTSANKIAPNSTLTITVSANKSRHRQVGAFFIRLTNGLSVPITVGAK